MRVYVRDNNVMQAYRKLKKKLYNEGVVQELVDRKYYMKPSDRKRIKRKDAIRRARNEQNKRLKKL